MGELVVITQSRDCPLLLWNTLSVGSEGEGGALGTEPNFLLNSALLGWYIPDTLWK